MLCCVELTQFTFELNVQNAIVNSAYEQAAQYGVEIYLAISQERKCFGDNRLPCIGLNPTKSAYFGSDECKTVRNEFPLLHLTLHLLLQTFPLCAHAQQGQAFGRTGFIPILHASACSISRTVQAVSRTVQAVAALSAASLYLRCIPCGSVL